MSIDLTWKTTTLSGQSQKSEEREDLRVVSEIMLLRRHQKPFVPIRLERRLSREKVSIERTSC